MRSRSSSSERHDLAAQSHVCAAPDGLGRGALDEGLLAVAFDVHDRHALAHALEGQLVDFRPFDQLRLQVEAGLLRGDQQTAFGGVADHAPAVVLFGRQDLGVVAERHGAQQGLEPAVCLGLRQCRVADHEVAHGRVAGARDLDVVAVGPDRLERHLGLGEGAGLVGGDHVSGAESLDAGEVLDERLGLGHALHADRQGDRQGGRQALGDECDHDAEGEQQGADPVEPEDLAHEEQRDTADHGDDRDRLRHAVDLAHERRLLLRDSGRERVDAAELGLEPGGEDDGTAGARGHAGAHEDEVGHVDRRQLLLDDRVGRLAHRVRLAGEGDVVGRELVLTHEARVGADAVALLQDDDVAGHQIGCGDDRHVAVTDDLCVGRHQLLQCLRGLLCTVLLEEPDGRVEEHHADDRDGDVDVVLAAGAGGEHGGGEHEDRRHLEHDREQAGELVEELEDDRPTDLGGQHVLAVFLQACEGVVFGKAFRRGAQVFVDALFGERPDVGHRWHQDGLPDRW